MARTVGIEEEFLLMRASAPHPAGDAVAEIAGHRSDGQFDHELQREQAELGTKPHESLSELGAELRLRRSELADSARRHGLRLAALATHPGPAGAASTTPEQRYERMTEVFGRVARMQLTCGMHVHVSVDSRAQGVAVLDRIRPWLPALVALSANSPFLDGEDTGYASYRSILWGQWPSAGVTEPFGDVAGYDRAVSTLVASGAAIDDGMVYFDARLSAKYPTIEVRVSDVSPFTDDAVTIAALVRAMVSTAAAHAVQGKPPPDMRTELLRAAAWRAARWGMNGKLVRGVDAVLVPAWDQINALLAWCAAALDDTGDSNQVKDGLATIRRRGTGATLQRAALAADHGWDTVIDAVVAETVN
jgi:carboxylate-amine ligase